MTRKSKRLPKTAVRDTWPTWRRKDFAGNCKPPKHKTSPTKVTKVSHRQLLQIIQGRYAHHYAETKLRKGGVSAGIKRIVYKHLGAYLNKTYGITKKSAKYHCDVMASHFIDYAFLQHESDNRAFDLNALVSYAVNATYRYLSLQGITGNWFYVDINRAHVVGFYVRDSAQKKFILPFIKAVNKMSDELHPVIEAHRNSND